MIVKKYKRKQFLIENSHKMDDKFSWQRALDMESRPGSGFMPGSESGSGKEIFMDPDPI